MRRAVLLVFALSMFLLTGCGDSPEKVYKDQLSALGEMCDALESIKDKETAEKARTKIETLSKKLKDIEERGKKLKIDELAKEKKEALRAKYKDDVTKLALRMTAAKDKIANDKDYESFLKVVNFQGEGK